MNLNDTINNNVKKQINICIAKIGKSMLFMSKKWGIIGGDYEIAKFVISLAEMNPNIHFWLIGKNDWSKLDPQLQTKFNVNNNIHDVWKSFNRKIFKADEHTWPTHYLKQNNIKIDFGWIFSGPASAISLKNSVINQKTGEYYKTLMFIDKYIAPIVYFFNSNKDVKWLEFGEDARYYPCSAKDLLNPPEVVISTRNFKHKPINRFIDETFTISKPMITKIINGYADRFIVIGEDIPKNNYDFEKRTNLMSIYCNGVRGKIAKIKYDIIKNYIFENIDKDNTINIYGEWDTNEDFFDEEKYKTKFINIPMIDLVEEMKNTKYTYMFPVESGWCSSKFWKIIYFGIIPFFHYNMDIDKSQPIPDYLRIKDEKDLYTKINYLENNNDFRKQIFDELQSLLNDEYFNGKYFNNLFLQYIEDYSNIDKETINYLRNTTNELKINKIKILTK